MKFMHLGDLHLGKRVHEYSMLENQRDILEKILEISIRENIDGMLIAGDIYDKTIPGAEAVELFDNFLTSLAARKVQTFIISGNHDSPERIAYGARIMKKQGIYLSEVFKGAVEPIVLNDDYGELAIYMLPFIKPVQVKHYYKDVQVETYQEAVAQVLSTLQVDRTRRNILLTHQSVGSGETEECAGGTEFIDYRLFEEFDYTALGHLHRPHCVGRNTVRYSGSPLKYSFSEAEHEKTVTIVEFLEKGTINITEKPLLPKYDMREIKGPIERLTDPTVYAGTNLQDYMHVTLTNEEEILDAIGKIRAVYKNVMWLDFDNRNIYTGQNAEMLADMEKYSPIELFEQFYKEQNGCPLSEEQKQLAETYLQEGGSTV